MIHHSGHFSRRFPALSTTAKCIDAEDLLRAAPEWLPNNRGLTVEQAAKVVQLGRSKAYELTVEWETTGGASGLPFVWFGHQKRISRAAIEQFIERTLRSPVT